ncbi:hypothetical protein [Microbacterium sp. UCD-TDU]|uniref:hypothetical protein n=1 Tax=Microbacterium sp. UCD-TDU TaxID=1247714 RepID=UPI001F41CCE0|nr:hypothetical protein [Microbacterium sp. UCD-TDU]
MADFTMLTPGAGTTGISVVDGGETGGSPVGGVPVAVAVFDTLPESTSACVSTYDAVHTT